MSRARDIANLINVAPSIYATDDEAVLKALVDAKGDLITGTADNAVGRLAVGTNGHLLSAASGETAGMQWVAPPVGGLVHIVSTTKTDTFTSSSTSFTSITGLTATITPTSASNKIYVMVTVNLGGVTSGTAQCMMVLKRGETDILVGDAAGSRTRASSENGIDSTFGQETVAMSILDSPATTSSITYGVNMRATGGTGFHINRGSSDQDVSFDSRTASTITLMEVAG